MKIPLGPDAPEKAPPPSNGFDELVEQLQEAYPTASYKLLTQALAECRKEANDPNDRERLIRCVRERITA